MAQNRHINHTSFCHKESQEGKRRIEKKMQSKPATANKPWGEAQFMEGFAFKHEDVKLSVQHPHKTLGIVVFICVPGTGEGTREGSGDRWLASLV